MSQMQYEQHNAAIDTWWGGDERREPQAERLFDLLDAEFMGDREQGEFEATFACLQEGWLDSDDLYALT